MSKKKKQKQNDTQLVKKIKNDLFVKTFIIIIAELTLRVNTHIFFPVKTDEIIS